MKESDMNEVITIEQIEAATLEKPQAEYAGDPKATWDYWTGLYNPPSGPSDEIVWARLRHRRDRALAACDWRMVSDATWDVDSWAEYRQALRDLPEQVTDPRKAVWPTRPE
jgi:hypothetical protein